MKKNMLHVLAMLTILLSYVAAHWAVYFSLVKFFDIVNFATKNILLWSLVFLGASFFI